MEGLWVHRILSFAKPPQPETLDTKIFLPHDLFFRLKGLLPRFHFKRKETTSSYNKFLKRKRVQQKIKTTQIFSCWKQKQALET
jgi:hypothetical protein